MHCDPRKLLLRRLALGFLLCAVPGLWRSATPAGSEPRSQVSDSAVQDAIKVLRDAEAAKHRGEYDRAMLLCQQVLDRFSKERTPGFEQAQGAIYQAHWLISRVHLLKGDRAAYVRQLELMADLFRETAFEQAVVYHLAIHYASVRMPERGLALLRRALGDPQDRVYARVFSASVDCYSAMERWESVVLVLERAIQRCEATPQKKEPLLHSERKVARWDQALDDARKHALEAPPVTRMLGYLDLLKAGQTERAYGYLSDETRKEFSLERFADPRGPWRIPSADLEKAEDPRQETVEDTRALTVIRLRLADNTPDAAPRLVRFHWARDDNGIWWLEKVAVAAPDGK